MAFFFVVGQHTRGVDVLVVVDEPSGTVLGDVMAGTADGQTWVIRDDVLPTSSGYFDVVYSEKHSQFCTFAPGASPKSYMTSDLGVNWTAGSAMPNGNGAGICWSPDLELFLVATAAANNSMTSTDGLAWTARTHASVGARICQPIWAGGTIQKFLICYNQNINPLSDSKIITSSDGTTWSATSEPFGAQNQGMTSLCYSPDRDEILGVSGNKNSPGVYSRLAWRSSDAVNWSSSTIVAADHQWSKVIWSHRLQKYVAITGFGGDFLSEDDNMSAVSSDGITWTTATDLPVSRPWRCLAETGKCLVALVGGGTDGDIAAVSLDGLSWDEVALPDTRYWSGLAPAANLGTV